MTRRHVFSLMAVVLIAGSLAAVWYFGRGARTAVENNVSLPASATSTILELPPEDADSPLLRRTPGVERRYVNDALHFSFDLPDGFTAADQQPKGNLGLQAVIVVNKAGDGFLVIAQKLKAGSGALTAADIQSNAPDETIANIRPTLIQGGISGFAFDTDNPLWKGDGKGVWFAHDGYLYRLETYTKDLPLLDFARVTWGWQ